MQITELRILPPVAIGRLGSGAVPVEAYTLEIAPERPLDFRRIVPRETFTVARDTGAITAHTPDHIQFKEVSSLEAKDGKIRPVAPFLEVFAITDADPGRLVPLTPRLLEAAGRSLADLSWDVEVGNIKVFRRTRDESDKIRAAVTGITDHTVHPLRGECAHFRPGKTLPLGSVQFIAPSDQHPGIRLRFTPGEGKVYGSSLERITGVDKSGKPKSEKDPVICDESLILYDAARGCWQGYCESATPNPHYTNPAQIFAGYNDSKGNRISWGYLDDECDGFVSVHLRVPDGTRLTARAHISAGPPAFAPDTLPVRVVSDELEQILFGPEVTGDVPIEAAEEIIRRAFETIRLMNTAVMNGNPVDGRLNVASTMVRQDTNDFGRLYEPIMATSLVDNLALRALHERIFNGLSTGAAPWFSETLRRPEEIGDLSTQKRRKMPALMRGADGRSLTLTHRQINTIVRAAVSSLFTDHPATAPAAAAPGEPALAAANLTAQLHYQGQGNPLSVLPRTAISNCFPGLEFDFRNLWRRAFRGIVLIENNNLVVEADPPHADLKDCRLVAIDYKPTTVATQGPVFPDGDNVPLQTADNPNGVSFMEWSNSMASVLAKQGQEVTCHFTVAPSLTEVVATRQELDDPRKYRPVTLRVNRFFEGNSAAFTADIIQPGELTQGLCAPWQNDYRECACYYWAASRPDFVNVTPDAKGLSTGDNWLSKRRTGTYIPDNRTDTRLVTYDDLFKNWEGELNFIVGGNDATGTGSTPAPNGPDQANA